MGEDVAEVADHVDREHVAHEEHKREIDDHVDRHCSRRHVESVQVVELLHGHVVASDPVQRS